MYIAANISDTSLVLDNNVFTHLRKDKLPYAEQLVREYIQQHLRPPALTSITIFEALYGVELEASSGKLTEEEAQIYRNSIEEVARDFETLNFNKRSAQIAAYIYPRVSAYIEKFPFQPKKIGKKKLRPRDIRDEKLRDIWKDVLVAATAWAHGYGVATGNREDFELIGNQLPQDWAPLRLAIWKP